MERKQKQRAGKKERGAREIVRGRRRERGSGKKSYL